MSLLKFKVVNNGTDDGHTIAADFNISSNFSMLELSHGSVLLEKIYEFGMFVNLWHDICGNLASFPTMSNLLEGQSTNITSRE